MAIFISGYVGCGWVGLGVRMGWAWGEKGGKEGTEGQAWGLQNGVVRNYAFRQGELLEFRVNLRMKPLCWCETVWLGLQLAPQWAPVIRIRRQTVSLYVVAKLSHHRGYIC